MIIIPIHYDRVILHFDSWTTRRSAPNRQKVYKFYLEKKKTTEDTSADYGMKLNESNAVNETKTAKRKY